MTQSIAWRVLVVEDDPTIGKELVDALTAESWLDATTSFNVNLVTSFQEALQDLGRSRFDLLVLDLKDDVTIKDTATEDQAKPGLDILNELKRTRFVPVVFYTGLPEHVADLKSPFVRLVEKTEGIARVRAEIRRLLETRLPILSRYLEEQQRQYFWEFVETRWKDESGTQETVDFAYLMARRLAAGLRSEFSRMAAETMGGANATPGRKDQSHPMEHYVFPPIQQSWNAGDILRKKGDTTYFVALTPTCDFVQKKAKFFLLARCAPLVTFEEYSTWCGSGQPPLFDGNSDKVTSLMRDGRGDRFKFLPGTHEFPDLVVDLQQLLSVPLEDQEGFERLASMDSPYAETLLARFARFYGRIGTPDLDVDLAKARARSRAQSAGQSG